MAEPEPNVAHLTLDLGHVAGAVHAPGNPLLAALRTLSPYELAEVRLLALHLTSSLAALEEEAAAALLRSPTVPGYVGGVFAPAGPEEPGEDG